MHSCSCYWIGTVGKVISRITDGMLKGINSIIQAATRSNEGLSNYRIIRNLITYHLADKLDITQSKASLTTHPFSEDLQFAQIPDLHEQGMSRSKQGI